METNRFRNSTGDNQLFDEIWRSLIDTQTDESQAIQHASNSIDSINIVEQGDHFQLNSDFVSLLEEADFSRFLDTSNKDSGATEVDEIVTLQDTTEQVHATNHTNEPSHSDQERTYNQHPYPPTRTLATSSEHDQPYFTFSSCNIHDLIKKYDFDLTGRRTRQRRNNRIIRLNTHGHAILTQTETSKEDIMNVIHQEFPDPILKYACIGEISQSKTTKPLLGIQIILRKVVNRRVWFLDSITNDPNCNYHVTTNDRPWNYYIKQANKFLEYGTFRSVHSRSKTTSSSTSTSINVSVSPSTTITTPIVADHEVTFTIPSMPNNQLPVSNTLTKPIDHNRSVESYNDTANRAMELANEDINAAMDLMRKEMPSYEFLINSAQYLATFQYIQNRSQRNTTNEAALHTHSMIVHHH